MKKILLFFIILMTHFTINSPSCHAETAKGDCGVINGEHHSYTVCAPKGWIFDNQSGVSQGLHAVFYPAGSSWQNSSVVMYMNWAAKEDVIRNIDDLVKYNIERFKKNGSPNVKAQFIRKIKNEKDAKGQIWAFTGDKWGNYEWVCYFNEKRGIVMAVLSSRKKEDFESSRNAFIELSKSYSFVPNGAK